MSLAVFGVSVQPTIRMIPDYAAPRVGNLGGESLAAAPGDLSADHMAAAARAEPASALGRGRYEQARSAGRRSLVVGELWLARVIQLRFRVLSQTVIPPWAAQMGNLEDDPVGHARQTTARSRPSLPRSSTPHLSRHLPSVSR
jgi:hypothetical protein